MRPWMNHTGEFPPHLQEVDGVLMPEPRVIEVRPLSISQCDSLSLPLSFYLCLSVSRSLARSLTI